MKLLPGFPGSTRSFPAASATPFVGTTPTRLAYASPGASDISCGSCATLWQVERVHVVGWKM